LNVSNIQTLFLRFSDVGKTFSQLLFGASCSARDVLCSTMLEISILHVTYEILQLFWQIFMSHMSHFLR